MKILQITNKVPYPPKDGGSVAVLNLGLGLADKNHEVHLFAINTSKHFVSKGILAGKLNGYKSVHTVYLNTELSVKEAANNLFFSARPYVYERFYGSIVRGALRNLLKTNAFDAVLLEGLYLTPYLDEIRKNSKALVLFRAHNLEHEIWQRAARRERNPLKRMYFHITAKRLKRVEEYIVNQYDALIPITRRDQEVFDEMGNTKPVHVVPASINTEKFAAYNTAKNQGDVFYLGALDWFPNQEGILWFLRKVWPLFYSRFPDTNLFIAGRNAPEWMEKALKKPGVKYYGEVDDAIDYMIKRKIMVVPLFSGSGMRVKIIEGMAAGRAIITTSIGAEGIPVTHGRELFIADDAETFQYYLELLINDKEGRKTMGNQAKIFAEEYFNNATISKNLEQFIKHRIA